MRNQKNSIETIGNVGAASVVSTLKVGVTDNLSSLLSVDCIIEAVINKVMHIKYLEELEKKVVPFVIKYTTLQGLKVIEGCEIVPDRKLDDKYLTAEW